MSAVFPGRPQSRIQALDTASWLGRRLVTYVSFNALIILAGPDKLLQTITHGNEDSLTAVAIDPASGKIVVSTLSTVYVYAPYGEEYGALSWSLVHTVTPSNRDEQIQCLSFGLPEEVLIAGERLTILATNERGGAKEIWSSALANSVKLASFSHDASLIASCGHHDRLAKIWRRLFSGGDEEKFEAAYLPHPKAVTGLRWRGRPAGEHHVETVLYTICADDQVRIWTGEDPHCLQILHLWGKLDVLQALQPRSPIPESYRQKRYAFILDNWELQDLLDRALEHIGDSEREIATRMHLKEVASQRAEAAFIVDNSGFMSAWGLERVGHRAQLKHEIINIAHVDGFDMMIPPTDVPASDHVLCRCFAGENGIMHILAHSFDGRIQWLSCHIDHLFDPSPRTERLRLEASLTGNAKPIRFLRAHSSGRILSVSDDQEVVVWSRVNIANQCVIERHTTLETGLENLDGGFASENVIVLLHDHALSLWSLDGPTPLKLKMIEKGISPRSALGCVQVSQTDEHLTYTLILTQPKASAAIISITSPSHISPEFKISHRTIDYSRDSRDYSIKLTSSSTQGMAILRYDGIRDQADFFPAPLPGASKSIGEELSTCETHRIQISPDSILKLSKQLRMVVTFPTLSRFYIVDLRTRLLEHEEQLPAHEPVESFEWMSTKRQNEMLAVTTVHKVIVFTQTKSKQRPNEALWIPSYSLDAKIWTNNPIADAKWIDAKTLLVAAGNQMFVEHIHHQQQQHPNALGNTIKRLAKPSADALCDMQNAALPIYHPTFVELAVHSQGHDAAIKILQRLEAKMKFFTDVDALDSMLGLCLQDFEEMFQGAAPLDDSDSWTSKRSADLTERIDNFRLTNLQKSEQETLRASISALGEAVRHSGALDAFGLRFAFDLARQPAEEMSALPMPFVGWRAAVCASLCTSQDILTDLVSRKHNGKVDWKSARESGMFMWLADADAVRQQFEIIARNEYTKTEEKNPIDCSLYYLALKKKSVLAGLWRMATWNKEQSATIRLLSNNFEDPRWKTAALKNAYALLGRRRTEYAAAFFLLADHLRDACNVLANQLGDLQLAIAIARVYEGDDSPTFKSLLQDHVLPRALREGDRYLAVWAWRQLGREDLALKAFVEPLGSLIQSSQPPIKAYHLSTFDPCMHSMYDPLRNLWLSKNPRQAFPVAPRDETQFVLRCARVYRRMGADLIALDVARSWRITSTAVSSAAEKTGSPTGESNGVIQEEKAAVAPSALDGWTESSHSAATAAATTLSNGSTRKKVTEEPSASSILDNFNF